MNVTLRDVAKQLNKSYGNITYHFPTKEDVLFKLLDDMNAELLALQQFDKKEDVFLYLLNLPEYNYSISVKYLFFIIDYLEIKRNHVSIQKKIDVLNGIRKEKWHKILIQIKDQGYFNKNVSAQDLEYIMFLSYSIRVAYFQTEKPANYNKRYYSIIVNTLIKPYLSKKGLKVYDKWSA